MKINIQVILYCVLFAFIFSCKKRQETQLFEYMDSKYTNVDFANNISVNEEINVIDFQYCYNGGGVGIGDFNSDGFPDAVFTGNQVSSRIYLNQGELKFLDVTKESNFTTTDWVTGVSIVDINTDGLNKNGIPEFEETPK